MIYLIDDKKIRQEKDFNWTNDRFEKYREYLQPIHTLEDLQSRSDQVFQEGNILLYHESFIDKTDIRNEALYRRKRLGEFSQNKKSYLVLFTGSGNIRRLNENIANIPVSVLYRNLELFVKKYSDGEVDLKCLLFGCNPEVEEKLSTKINSELIEIDNSTLGKKGSNNLYIRTDENYIPNPFEGSEQEIIFDVTDLEFTNIINSKLNNVRYDNIFIPLCCGTTLSDYNGLRLATHIRCTKTINQTSRIFIYGVVDLESLLDHEYFNILRTKNVFMIPFSKRAICDATYMESDEYIEKELPAEVSKLSLLVPTNYEDNHSIANEWSIYRWAYAVNAKNEGIESIYDNVANNLHFKYLQTIYPVVKLEILSDQALKLNIPANCRILLIDDEAGKGWHKVIHRIVKDINKLEFDHIGAELAGKSDIQLIEYCLQRVEEYKPDIVILDFRLHQQDFNNIDINGITGLRVLQRIKEINKGIQVIIFTATNKIWNYQYLLDAGADGFILKENISDGEDSTKTIDSIKRMLLLLNDRSEYIYIKKLYERLFDLKKQLRPRRKYSHPKPLPKEFVDEVLKWFELSIDIIARNSNDSSKASSFLFLFSVLENLANRVINVDEPIQKTTSQGDTVYNYSFRGTDQRLRNFVKDENNEGYYRRTNSPMRTGRAIPWNLKILNTIDYITKQKVDEKRLSEVIIKRNDFIHSNSTSGNVFKVNDEDIKWLNETIYHGLLNVI